MESFGQRFLRLRKEKKLTQEDIAQKLNITAQSVSKWENDNSYPDVAILGDIASIFNITVDELLGREVKTTAILEEHERKDINKLVLKVKILSEDNKVNINLPVPLIIALTNSGSSMANINFGDKLQGIDFGMIVSLIEQGVVGQLVEIESADGSTIRISVE